MDIKILLSFLTLFTVPAVLLNGFTLVAIVGCRTLRKAAHVFTFNIALADFVSSFSVELLVWLQFSGSIGDYDLRVSTTIDAKIFLRFCNNYQILKQK